MRSEQTMNLPRSMPTMSPAPLHAGDALRANDEPGPHADGEVPMADGRIGLHRADEPGSHADGEVSIAECLHAEDCNHLAMSSSCLLLRPVPAGQ